MRTFDIEGIIPSIYSFIYLSIYLFIYLSIFYLFIYLFIYLIIYFNWDSPLKALIGHTMLSSYNNAWS